MVTVVIDIYVFLCPVLTQEISYGLLAIGAVLLLMSILGCVILCCDDMIAAICVSKYIL